MARGLATILATCAPIVLALACSAAQDEGGPDGGGDGAFPPTDGASRIDAGADAIVKGRCVDQPNGAPCGDGPEAGASDCRDAPTCQNGACVQQFKPDLSICGTSDPCVTGCSSGVCVAIPPRRDGFNWKPGDDNARCCGGKAIETTSNDNCGACGIKCNTTAESQQCATVGKEGHYYCTNCIQSPNCWSGCCSLSFSNPGACAASDCNDGLCITNFCPPYTTCKTSSDSSDYCSYDP